MENSNTTWETHVLFVASYNSLLPDDRYETTPGENQKMDDKHCGAQWLVSTTISMASWEKNTQLC